MSLIDVIIGGRYTIKQKIDNDRGGTSTVYRAVDGRLRKTVAIKLNTRTDPKYVEAFEYSVVNHAQLKHPSLVEMRDYIEEGNRQFAVMDFVFGETLTEVKNKENGPLGIEKVMMWMLQLLDVLQYIHTENWFHRDIKPDNIMLQPDGKIVLIDFGLITRTGTHLPNMRTTKYAAPEQGLDNLVLDPSTDLFALAATAYDLLTENIKSAEVRNKGVLENGRDPLELITYYRPDISKSISDVLHKALSLHRESRWQSAEAMRDAIKVALEHTQDTPSLRKPEEESKLEVTTLSNQNTKDINVYHLLLTNIWYWGSIAGIILLVVSYLLISLSSSIVMLLALVAVLSSIALIIPIQQKSNVALWVGLIQAITALCIAIWVVTTVNDVKGLWLILVGLTLIIFGGLVRMRSSEN